MFQSRAGLSKLALATVRLAGIVVARYRSAGSPTPRKGLQQMVNAAVIGVVEYAISANETDVIEARYLSTGSMALDAGAICRGRAVGDTSNGFPGDYVISYYGVDGGH